MERAVLRVVTFAGIGVGAGVLVAWRATRPVIKLAGRPTRQLYDHGRVGSCATDADAPGGAA